MPAATSRAHGPLPWATFVLPLTALAAVVYLPLLHVPFVADDYANLLYPGNFVAPASPLFRPVETVLFLLLRGAFGGNPLPWHMASVAGQVAAVLLAFTALRALHALLQSSETTGTDPGARAAGPAAATTVLWALTPRAVQAVVWPSALSDLAYSICVLAGLAHWLAARRSGRTWHLWAVGFWYAVGLGSKEAAVILPVVCGAADFCLARRTRLRPLLPQALVAALYALFQLDRPALLARLPWHPPFLYDVTGGYGFVGWAALARHLLVYPTLTLLPWVHQDWGYHWRHDVLLAIPVYALLGRWLTCGGARRFGALWLMITAAPAMLFAPFDVSDLYLYLPALGVALALATEAMEFYRRGRTMLALTVAAAVVTAQVLPLVHTEVAWRVDTAAFSRERSAILSAARAHPDATLVLRGLPAFSGEVYLFMDAFPYLMQWLAPGFTGRVLLNPRTCHTGLVLTFASDGSLAPVPNAC